MALVDAPDHHPPLHRLNRGFHWPQRSGPFDVLTDDQASSFDRDGFVVVDPAFGADEIAAVREEIDRREQRVEDFLAGLEDQRFGIAEAGAITFTINLAHRSALLREFVTHPILLGLCRDLVGPDVDLYWDQAVYKKPEKPRRFPWHQDNGYTLVDPQYYLTCWIALTDATDRQRMSGRGARAPPPRHLRAHLRRAARLADLRRGAGPCRRAGQRRWDRRVLLADPAHDRAEPHDPNRATRSARPTSCSTARPVHGSCPTTVATPPPVEPSATSRTRSPSCATAGPSPPDLAVHARSVRDLFRFPGPIAL